MTGFASYCLLASRGDSKARAVSALGQGTSPSSRGSAGNRPLAIRDDFLPGGRLDRRSRPEKRGFWRTLGASRVAHCRHFRARRQCGLLRIRLISASFGTPGAIRTHDLLLRSGEVVFWVVAGVRAEKRGTERIRADGSGNSGRFRSLRAPERNGIQRNCAEWTGGHKPPLAPNGAACRGTADARRVEPTGAIRGADCAGRPRLAEWGP